MLASVIGVISDETLATISWEKEFVKNKKIRERWYSLFIILIYKKNSIEIKKTES
tara:strand:+ start:130 stop:294 length:165 start_codon:yes stop_codon:yes gene_type:complete